jgi:hypothetical protein
MSPQRKKICSNCGEDRFLKNFYKTKDGNHTSWCKECIKLYQRDRNGVKKVVVICNSREKMCSFCKEIKSVKDFIKLGFCKKQKKLTYSADCRKCKNKKSRDRVLVNSQVSEALSLSVLI